MKITKAMWQQHSKNMNKVRWSKYTKEERSAYMKDLAAKKKLKAKEKAKSRELPTA